MAELKPLVDINGQTQELPDGDSIAGAGTLAGALIFPASATVTPPPLANNVDNWVISGLINKSVIYASTTGGNEEVTGISSTGIVNGQTFFLYNTSGGDLKLKNNNANSLAVNRILLDADINIKVNMGVVLTYDGGVSRWRVNYFK